MSGLRKTSSPPGSEEPKKLARLLIFLQALADKVGVWRSQNMICTAINQFQSLFLSGSKRIWETRRRVKIENCLTLELNLRVMHLPFGNHEERQVDESKRVLRDK